MQVRVRALVVVRLAYSLACSLASDVLVSRAKSLGREKKLSVHAIAQWQAWPWRTPAAESMFSGLVDSFTLHAWTYP